MNVLLLSMPDSFEHTPTVSIRMPNGALTSLAGNVDPHHRIAVADLVLIQKRVRATIQRFMEEIQPELVGLSVMTFQRKTAGKIIELLRSLRPAVRIVVGGYDPSMAPEAYVGSDVDFIVRGEGEITFRELLRAIETDRDYERISGLSYRVANRFRHNPDRPVSGLDSCEIRLPNRDARVLSDCTMLGRQVDVVETSRGCTFDCSFCSIIAMRGRQFHAFSFDRVLADIRDARAHGAQAMTSAIANHRETLVPLMREAGFRYVFLGIENILEEDLNFLRASSKNARREKGRNVGNPEDTRQSIEANLEFARRYVDWPYIQHPTPYPRTPMTKDFYERGLIINENSEEYDGTTAVVRTDHLTAEAVEFLRWRAERWMKLRHLPVVLFHSPWFTLRNGPKMLAHIFRGATIKSLLGLEDEKKAFERYRAIRRVERAYV